MRSSTLRPAYIAHRLGTGPDRADNIKAAAHWVAWLTERYRIEPVCPWIVLASVWPETMRDFGLAVDRAAVERTGLMIACGAEPGLSPGMQAEADWATTVVDITGMDVAERIGFALAAVGIQRRSEPDALHPLEEQRRSFAHGNVSLHNSDVTRETVDAEAEKLTRERGEVGRRLFTASPGPV